MRQFRKNLIIGEIGIKQIIFFIEKQIPSNQLKSKQ